MCNKTQSLLKKIHQSLIPSTYQQIIYDMADVGNYDQATGSRLSNYTIYLNTGRSIRTIKRAKSFGQKSGILIRTKAHDMRRGHATTYSFNLPLLEIMAQQSKEIYRNEREEAILRAEANAGEKAMRTEENQKHRESFEQHLCGKPLEQPVDKPKSGDRVVPESGDREHRRMIVKDYLNTVGIDETVDNPPINREVDLADSLTSFEKNGIYDFLDECYKGGIAIPPRYRAMFEQRAA